MRAVDPDIEDLHSVIAAASMNAAARIRSILKARLAPIPITLSCGGGNEPGVALGDRRAQLKVER
jgi:hypothetical protein